MATILLQAAGGALGGLVGGPFGAVAGRALGALGGYAIDSQLFGRRQRIEGSRLRAGRVLEADEGAGIARLYGTARIAGQVIWTTRFEEESATERQGGKGGAPSGGAAEVTTYSYFGNVAIGLCEGPIACVRRVWADGEEMDLSAVTFRVHRGDEAQQPDPLIEAKQGEGRAPPYRGLAYVVFERLPLERWGNRIPQIACEVVRPVGELEAELRAVTIIPGASEHGLDPSPVRETLRAGEDRLPNRNILHGASDFAASLDELTALCPKLERGALVVSWFADDLRAGHAAVKPGVEVRERNEDEAWRVAGLERDGAHLVTQVNGGPAYGGTPSDAGVVRAIQSLKARGLKVTHYPFILMDVPAGNALPDPYGGTRQAAYPWRGRMTLDREPGRAGSPDGTVAARTAVSAFVGTALPSHFSVGDGRVHYAGPAEWTLRRMVLHQAFLAKAAGGVDAFVIASEMRGLTRVRDETGAFPFVKALIALGQDVKAVLPGTKITYAADWSEYFGYQPADGSGDLFYNLDPLWADPAICMVGIDNYLPLADWRAEDWLDGGPDGASSPYDRAALAAGIAGGEHGDWFYASEHDRRARVRTAITDGSGGKPWVFRPKDIRAWWANEHRERRGGIEVAAASAWVPRSKPIWFTELGCPAIDKGANQPNVFVDPKSAESAFPYFSTGARDDHQQRRFLEAHLAHWDPARPGFREEDNPLSPVYGGRMVNPGAIHLWTWDARPYPAFPARRDVWSDGGNWERGHWLTGRLGKAPLDALIARLLRDHGFTDFDVSGVDAEVGGFLVPGPGAARDEIDELMRLTGVTAHASRGRLVFRSARRAVAACVLDAVADRGDVPFVEIRRAEETDAPEEIVVGYADPARAYQSAAAGAALPDSLNARQDTVELPVTLDEREARRFAEALLADRLSGRETASFALPPAAVAVEPGDVVALPAVDGRWSVLRIEDGETRRVEARRLPLPAREARGEAPDATPAPIPAAPVLASKPLAYLLDLPSFGLNDEGARFAVFAKPWLPYALAASPAADGFRTRTMAGRSATVGRLAAPLRPGPEGVIDRGNVVTVELLGGALFSVSRDALLGGANACAVRGESGAWEVLQFETAEEILPMRFRLSNLLRAAGGTDEAMRAGAPAGSPFVLLDAAAGPLPLAMLERGVLLNWRVTPAGRPLDDGAGVTQGAVLGLAALRPLSPVHLRCAFPGGGGLALTWVRRTRDDGDRWEGADVPLGEAAERYRVTLRSGATAADFETTEPRLALSGTEEAARFGGPVAMLDVNVAQVSLTVGPGSFRRALFYRPV